MSRLVDVVVKALQEDNSIATDRASLENIKVLFSEEYFAYLGVSKQDLKRLERKGLAIRWYEQSQKKTSTGLMKSETKVKWILIGDKTNDNSKTVSKG